MWLGPCGLVWLMRPRHHHSSMLVRVSIAVVASDSRLAELGGEFGGGGGGGGGVGGVICSRLALFAVGVGG
jgi:hypothetical protein